MINRVKQFTKGLTAKVTDEEYNWVKTHLTPEEYHLFLQLRRDEQRHCIDVARVFKEEDMIRLGLLHDIGKLRYPLNLSEKSLMVIADKLTKGKIKNLNQLNIVKGYYEHPKIGQELLMTIGQTDRVFLERVKNHHNTHIKDKKLQIFQEVDNHY